MRLPEYNNAAGRLLQVMQQLPMNDQQLERKQIAEALGVPNEWSNIFVALNDLHSEFATLCLDIEQHQENEAKYKLYKANLGEIEKSLRSFNINLSNDKCSCRMSQTGILALEYIAVDLPQDERPDQSDLDRIRKLVNELQGEIEKAEEFSKSVKGWLLDLVRVIRDSLDRFAIRGSRAMRKQISFLAGELVLNWTVAQKVQRERPSFWQRFIEAIDLMNKLATLAEKSKPAITFAQKLLPVLKSVGLPAPENTPTDNES